MSIVIQNTADLAAIWTAWFFYGPSGSGKTRAAATFPKPFFIVPQNEKSINTLRGLDMPYTTVTNRNDVMQTLAYLEAQYAQMLRLLAADKPDEADGVFPWQTIVFESVSHYSDLVVQDLSQDGMKRMDFEQWGKLSSHLRTIQNRLRAMDVHSIFTSLDTTSEDGNSGGPLISGQMRVKMPSACDYIGYFESVSANKRTVYRTHWRQYGKFFARVRQSDMDREKYGEFPAMVEDFHFDKVRGFIGL